VDPVGFRSVLSETIDNVSGAGVVVYAKGPGVSINPRGTGQPGTVVVSDSFDQAPGSSGGALARDGPEAKAQDMLARGRLLPPFDFVTVTVALADPDAMRRAGELHARLYAWAILVMAAGIIAGVSLVLVEAAVAVKRARSRSDFVIGVSHDLRTPLASMKMLAESLHLRRVRNEDTRRQFLVTIVRECERLSQLIERVLFFVRFGQNALAYHMAPTDLGRLVESAIRLFEARYTEEAEQAAQGRQQKPGASPPQVDLQMDQNLPEVLADDSAMTQVVLNLLDNAVKYSRQSMSRDSVPVNLSIHGVTRRSRIYRQPRPWVSISVKDRGIGIGRRELRKVFRRFYRVPGAVRENVSGVGLGLALCRHVVEAHGGWIDVESTPGEGSVFSVYLPALTDDRRRRAEDGERPSPKAGPGPRLR
jgi:signal transduction histidine kinase